MKFQMTLVSFEILKTIYFLFDKYPKSPVNIVFKISNKKKIKKIWVLSIFKVIIITVSSYHDKIFDDVMFYAIYNIIYLLYNIINI